MRNILLIALAFIILHIALIFLAPSAIPRVDMFPYRNVLNDYKPKTLSYLANFDGIQYISIARDGYMQFQQGYFPLFPVAIFLVSPFFLWNHLLAGLTLSWIFLSFGIFYIKKLSDLILPNKSDSYWVIILLLTFPTAFFYVSLYPESLFLFLASASLYYIYKRNYLFAFVFSAFATLCKIQGIFLIIPFLFSVLNISEFVSKRVSLGEIIQDTYISIKKGVLKKKAKQLLLALSPLYALSFFSLYLFIFYKDPFYYYHAQDVFGANRTSNSIVLLPQVIYRYIKILFTSQKNFQYAIAFLELTIFLFVMGVLLYNLYIVMKQRRNRKAMSRLSLLLFSLCVLLLPTLTGTLSSIPRYALSSIGFFIVFAQLNNRLTMIGITFVFFLIQVILFMYFIKGYFIS